MSMMANMIFEYERIGYNMNMNIASSNFVGRLSPKGFDHHFQLYCGLDS